jgi:glycine cleavage system transcriptional repressor
MRTNIVFTLTGSDRVGIVESVTKMLLDLGGNVEASRMARLGGEFAMLMLVSIPAETLPSLEEGVEKFRTEGFKVTTSQTEHTYAEKFPGWLPFQIEVNGADHEGIIHQVARYLSARGINIESMDTATTPAPHTGTPVFNMSALVLVPPKLNGQDWEDDLEDVANQLDVDIEISNVNV